MDIRSRAYPPLPVLTEIVLYLDKGLGLHLEERGILAVHLQRLVPPKLVDVVLWIRFYTFLSSFIYRSRNKSHYLPG